VRVYAAAGNPPGPSWSCDDKFAELTARYDAAGYFGAAPTPVPLPTSAISTQRVPVSPILRGESISVGSWSPHGEYLVFGMREFSGGQDVTGLYFLKAETGEVCQADERKWVTDLQTDGVYQHFAWLPDGRLLYVSEARETIVFKPCAAEVEDLTRRYPSTFTQAASFDEDSGRVLLKNHDSYWLLDGADLQARPIRGVTPNPNEFHPDRYAWSSGGERLVISRLNGQVPNAGSTLYVVDGSAGQVMRSLAVDYTSDPDAPIVDWLTRDELLVQGGGSLRVMDLRSDPPQTTDLVRDVFLLDAVYPADFSSLDFLPNLAGDGYYLGVRVNHPHNQDAYLYDSKSGQVEVFQHDADTLLFFPGDQWMRLPKWEGTPTYRDDYEMVWMEQPGETVRLLVEGHVPRRQPQLFPQYLPKVSQMVFGSSQGVSLVSIPDGKTIRFWQLVGKHGNSSIVYASPLGEALVVVADGDSLYYIPLPID
jgi:dipeptidyl aminopeptidase/acylaminoacyl peptidase